ncbi:carbohydrate ABC transporter permease [Nakamurella antarctica]|uniref:Carbohydrate ABC transporter permease n=1 Tax=Nakamurella antarctica TaxID=1902245 RepID=A0A3G8ZHY7_9ACTN|nr:carbohydrate ABC transporter permease [Nakamurella antarctica]AZI56848.1 carbohydrate ABC transporter permease [Nakamurella antarctica]
MTFIDVDEAPTDTPHSGRHTKKAHREKVTFGRITLWILLIVFALVSVIPMIWLLIAPSKTSAQLNDDAPFSFGKFSNYKLAWENLQTFQDGVIVEWVVNSLVYTLVIVAVSCVTAILAGYALAVTALPFKRTLLITTLVATIIPPVALVIPLFVEISDLGLYDTPASVILTSSFYPFGVFLAYIYFSTSIPPELFEAARVDGAGEFKTFFLIVLPLSKGLFGMLAFFSFSAAWVNYFLPYVMLGSAENYTLPVGLGILFSSTPALNPSNGAQQSVIGRPEIALAGLIVAVPILIVFLISSRLLVRGVLAGAVKS